MPPFDLNIVAKAQAGDRVAFQRIIEAHYTMIYRVAYRFLGTQADAEDITQDICVALPAKLASFRGESHFSTWLYRVAMNACRDFLKKKSSHQNLEHCYLEMEKSLSAEQQESGRKSAWLYRNLTTLDASLRETALLVLAEELSHAEAASVLNCAESTISWRMHEIRKRLKQLVDTYP